MCGAVMMIDSEDVICEKGEGCGEDAVPEKWKG